MKNDNLNHAVLELKVINNQRIEGLISDCEYLLKVVEIVHRVDLNELLAENELERAACETLLRKERPDLFID